MLAQFLKDHEVANVLTHKDPDGDAIGTSFALAFYLKKFGIQPRVYLFGALPRWYQDVVNILGIDFDVFVDQVPDEKHALVLVDASRLSRCGDLVKDLRNPDVIIDHHEEEPEASCVYHNKYIGSTCELFYIIAKNHLNANDKSLAGYLLLGMYQDTLGFTVNTNYKTLEYASHLLKIAGSDVMESVHRALIPIYSQDEYILFESIKRSFRVVGNLMVYCVNALDYQNYQFPALFQIGKHVLYERARIEGVAGKMFALWSPDVARISIRTSDGNAHRIAHLFGGGGHQDAAGAYIRQPESTFQDFYDSVCEKIKRIVG